MVNALFMEAVTNGTASWDVITQFALLFVVQAALSVRAGNILVSDTPQQSEGVDRPGMRYSDMQLQLNGSTVADITGHWRARNHKASK
jgi:hypothetical protein